MMAVYSCVSENMDRPMAVEYCCYLPLKCKAKIYVTSGDDRLLAADLLSAKPAIFDLPRGTYTLTSESIHNSSDRVAQGRIQGFG